MTSRSAIVKLVGVLVCLKFAYILISAAAIDLSSREDNIAQSILDKAINIGMRKDAFWYKKIAALGYPVGAVGTDGKRLIDFSQGQSMWAFFPAYPVVNRWISQISGARYELAAMTASLLYSFLALLGCFLFCKNYWQDTGKAFWTTLLIFVFPFHFYFSMYLTEAPFFACLIWAFYWIQENRHVALAITLVPLVLLRPNGLLMLLPIVLFYLERSGSLSFKKENIRPLIMGITFCIPAVLVFAGYLWYQYEMTGTAMAFSSAQAGWGKEFMFPLVALFRRGDINYQVTSTYVVAVSVLMIAYCRRLPISLIILVMIGLLLPLTAGSTYSMIRYLSVVFPLFLILSDITYRYRYRLVFLFILVVGHLTSFCLWLVDHPLGF